jgi:uncharacterized SAM-binding protein YcdF (DUF218 family)
LGILNQIKSFWHPKAYLPIKKLLWRICKKQQHLLAIPSFLLMIFFILGIFAHIIFVPIYWINQNCAQQHLVAMMPKGFAAHWLHWFGHEQMGLGKMQLLIRQLARIRLALKQVMAFTQQKKRYSKTGKIKIFNKNLIIYSSIKYYFFFLRFRVDFVALDRPVSDSTNFRYH